MPRSLLDLRIPLFECGDWMQQQQQEQVLVTLCPLWSLHRRELLHQAHPLVLLLTAMAAF
jgi:hypothetical protein